MDGLAVDVVTGWSAVAWLAAWSVPLSIVDLRTGRLPSPMVNRLLAGLVVLTLAGGLASGSMRPIVWSLVGAAAFGGLLLAVRGLAGDGLGGGDVRLAVPLGWFLGELKDPGVSVPACCPPGGVGQMQPLAGQVSRGDG